MKWTFNFYWSWTKWLVGVCYDNDRWMAQENMHCIAVHLGPARRTATTAAIKKRSLYGANLTRLDSLAATAASRPARARSPAGRSLDACTGKAPSFVTAINTTDPMYVPSHLFKPPYTIADANRYRELKAKILARELIPREDFLFVKKHDQYSNLLLRRRTRLGHLNTIRDDVLRMKQ